MIIDVVFELSVECGFLSVSLCSVVCKVGIVFNVFYCYFSDMEEFGLLFVDEIGLLFC